MGQSREASEAQGTPARPQQWPWEECASLESALPSSNTCIPVFLTGTRLPLLSVHVGRTGLTPGFRAGHVPQNCPAREYTLPALGLGLGTGM